MICPIVLIFGMPAWTQDSAVEITVLNLNSNQNYNMKWADTGAVIQPPHWTSAGKSEPVFYPRFKTINVDATFEVSEPYSGAIWIRATGTDGLTVPTEYLWLQASDSFVIETQTFEEAGTMTDNTIGYDGLQLDWYYSFDSSSGPWEYAGSTVNPCYIIFDIPHPPWSRNGGYDGGIPVYVEVMDFACVTANTAARVDQAYTDIIEKLYGYMEYDGGQHFTVQSALNFYIQDFVWHCNGYSSGPSEGNDCRDFGNFSLCLTGAIGDPGVRVVRIVDPGGPFQTHPIYPARWASPAHTGVLWNYHQLNYNTWLGWWYMIDGSLKLDSNIYNGNQWDPPGILAKYDIHWDDYVETLSSSDLTDLWNSDSCNLVEGPRP